MISAPNSFPNAMTLASPASNPPATSNLAIRSSQGRKSLLSPASSRDGGMEEDSPLRIQRAKLYGHPCGFSVSRILASLALSSGRGTAIVVRQRTTHLLTTHQAGHVQA